MRFRGVGQRLRGRLARGSIVIALAIWLAALGIRIVFALMPVSGVWEGGTPLATVVDALALEPSGRLLAGGPLGIHASTDQGRSWTELPGFVGQPVTAITITDQRAFAAGPGRIWQRQSEEWAIVPPPTQKNIYRLLVSDGQLLAATDEGLYASSLARLGEWQRLWPPSSSPPASAYSIHIVGDRTLVGTDDGIVERVGQASTWRHLGPDGARVIGISSGGGWIHVAVAGPRGGLARAMVGSDSWQYGRVATEFGADVLVDPREPSRVYAGLGGLADKNLIAGVVVSEDSGQTWLPVKSRLQNVLVADLAIDEQEDILYAGTNGGGVFRFQRPGILNVVAASVSPILDLVEPLLLGWLALMLLLSPRAVNR